jgi:hypothetical protein
MTEHIDDTIERLWQEVFIRAMVQVTAHVEIRTPPLDVLAERAGIIADAACREFVKRTSRKKVQTA